MPPHARSRAAQHVRATMHSSRLVLYHAVRVRIRGGGQAFVTDDRDERSLRAAQTRHPAQWHRDCHAHAGCAIAEFAVLVFCLRARAVECRQDIVAQEPRCKSLSACSVTGTPRAYLSCTPRPRGRETNALPVCQPAQCTLRVALATGSCVTMSWSRSTAPAVSKQNTQNCVISMAPLSPGRGRAWAWAWACAPWAATDMAR